MTLEEIIRRLMEQEGLSEAEARRRAEAEIRQRLSEISTERTNQINEAASTFGANATDIDLGTSEERQRLEGELNQLLEDQRNEFETNRQARIDADRQRREERAAEINRNGQLEQAYKFFTYLDTATTQGYNLNGLSEDEIIEMYNDFMTKPEYEQIRRETLDKAARNDREVVIPETRQAAEVTVDRQKELSDREAEIHQRLSEIANERTASMNEAASVYGVNATDVDLGASEERQNLESELEQIHKDQQAIFEENKQEKIAADKQRREERTTEINRNGKLEQAYKFFTYLDTTTTQGYNLNGLSEDEILALYDDFQTKPEYEQIKKETQERMAKGDREVVIPNQQTKEEPVVAGPALETDEEIEQTPEEALRELEEMQAKGKGQHINYEAEKKKLEAQIAANKFAAAAAATLTADEIGNFTSHKPTKETTAIAPVGVEDTAVTDLPADVQKGKTSAAPATLVAKAKEWIKNNKGKAIAIATALAAGLIVAGIAAYSALTGDTAAASQDPNTLASIATDIVNQGLNAIDLSAVDPSVTQAADPTTVQAFDPSVFSGSDQIVHQTAQDAINNTNGVVTNEYYQIDGGYVQNYVTGDNIDTDGMTREQIIDTLNSGTYDYVPTHDGVAMSHMSADEFEAISQGGRNL